MGCFCSCFDVDDTLNTTGNDNNANDGNRIIPNVYNKIASGNELAPNAAIIERENTQCETSRDTGSLLIEKEIGGHRYLYPASIEEEECPTCLEEYTPENPKIMTKCAHHFHLACIYEWLERNQNCPVCSQVMSFNDL